MALRAASVPGTWPQGWPQTLTKKTHVAWERDLASGMGSVCALALLAYAVARALGTVTLGRGHSASTFMVTVGLASVEGAWPEDCWGRGGHMARHSQLPICSYKCLGKWELPSSTGYF